MKNKEKAEKLAGILESLDLSGVTNDLLIIQALYKFSEDIEDRKLRTKVIEFLEDVGKEYSERDFEEEAKVEFCCSVCHKFLPLDKKVVEGHFVDICMDCNEQEKEAEEDEYD